MQDNIDNPPEVGIKKEGAPVGQKNVQNICYLNSILQTLYHIPKFVETILYLDFDNTEILYILYTYTWKHIFL